LAREGLPPLDSPEWRKLPFRSPKVAAFYVLMVKAGLRRPHPGLPIPKGLLPPADPEQSPRCRPSKKA
jgi:hypothetical protein